MRTAAAFLLLLAVQASAKDKPKDIRVWVQMAAPESEWVTDADADKDLAASTADVAEAVGKELTTAEDAESADLVVTVTYRGQLATGRTESGYTRVGTVVTNEETKPGIEFTITTPDGTVVGPMYGFVQPSMKRWKSAANKCRDAIVEFASRNYDKLIAAREPD